MRHAVFTPHTRLIARAVRRAFPLLLIASASAYAAVPTYNVNIPAGPLGRALASFASQTGTALSFDPALTSGRNAAALSGRFSASEGLQRLLEGSGLQLVAQDDGSYSLAKSPTEDTLNITANARAQEDPFGPGEGYLATRSATATKTDTPIMETPQSISIVDSTQITALRPKSLNDALAYTAGVTRSEGADRTTDSFNLRGFSATSGTGSLYRDGTKYSVNAYDGQQELYGLERVEVLKGASSVLFGTAAPGGVINTVTKRPTLTPLHELNLEYGSFARKQLSGDFAGALTDDNNWSYRLTGLVRDSNTFIDNINDDRIYVAPALKWSPDENTSLTFLSHYQKSKTDYVYGLPDSGTIAYNPNGKIARSRYTGIPGHDRSDTEEYSVGYLFDHNFSDSLKFRNSLSYYKSTLEQPSSYVDGVSDDGLSSTDRGASERTDHSDAVTSDTALTWETRTGIIDHQLMGGTDFNWQYHDTIRYNMDVSDQYNYFGANPAVTLGPKTQNLYSSKQYSTRLGLYAQDQMKIDDKWVLLLGARQDWAHDKTAPWFAGTGLSSTDEYSNATTYRAGLVYLADNGLAPFLSYSQSFEPQSGTDRRGVQFKPTTGDQYEAGIRYQPKGSAIMYTASVYQLTQQNILTTDPVDTDFQTQTGEVKSKGIELEAKGKLTENTQIIAAYAYTDARTTKSNTEANVGKRQGGVPFNQFSLWADYSFAVFGLPGLTAGSGIRYIGDTRGTYVDGTVPDYTLWDAMVSYQTGPWRFAVNGSNLTDKTYIASCTYGCFYGEGRNITGSVSYKW